MDEVFRNGKIGVQVGNLMSEVFVTLEHGSSPVRLRVGCTPDGLTITADGCEFVPTLVENRAGFEVRSREPAQLFRYPSGTQSGRPWDHSVDMGIEEG